MRSIAIKKFIAWVALAALFAALICYIGYRVAINWHPSIDRYPIQGVDVSHHQGDIDWNTLRDAGAQFAFIKATEGGDWIDSRFEENWREASEAGIPRGAYHFFTLCRSGREQAQNFIDVVPRESDALPPVVDLEFYGNCGRDLSPENLRRELSDFLDLVEAHYERRVIIYVLEDFDQQFEIIANFDRSLWLRSLIFRPEYGSRDWSIWQASSFRHMEGVDGRIDWNVLAPGVTLESLGDL